MKTLASVLVMLVLNLSSIANANGGDTFTCENTVLGGDVWPWCIALPFPWDDIQGFWKLGNDAASYLEARVESSVEVTGVKHKVVKISLFNEGICSKSYAAGVGYIDSSEENVLKAVIVSNFYKYQLKLAMFKASDISNYRGDQPTIIGISMWVLGENRDANSSNLKSYQRPKTDYVRNMTIRKLTLDVGKACKSSN